MTYSFKASNTKQLGRWVVDSRATDHMIHNITFFDSYKPTLGNQKITIVNDFATNIVGQESLHPTPTTPLKNIFHIPKLSTNLISIHIIAKELHCKIIFFYSYCDF